MAVLASSAVAHYPTNLSREFYPQGKGSRGVVQRSLKLTLTGQGDQTDTIGAAALGFEVLLSCSNLFDDENNKVYLAAVDPVTNTINLAATAADTTATVSSTGGYITVTGIPLLAA